MILKTLIGAAAAFALLIVSCGSPSDDDNADNPVDSIIPDDLSEPGRKGMEYMDAFRGDFVLCKKDKNGYYLPDAMSKLRTQGIDRRVWRF